MLVRVWLAALVFGAMTTAAMADDWVAVRLRGQVLQLVDDQWQPLKRGDVVSDDRVVRTLESGRVDFKRDAEVISLGPQTQIQIHDKVGQRFTTVTEYFGQVAVEAEVQNVKHFAVQTPTLAAVVKGTKFVVTSGKGWSKVDVQRGHVEVESELTHSTTLVSKGQSVTATDSNELAVSGRGQLPSVVDEAGNILAEDGLPVGNNGNGNSGNNGNGNSGNSGNGNSGNSGNGNSGNDGNGNSGNSGNGNSGNSGNGNSGNNGNGNSGNSGNGNSGNG